MHSLAHHPAHSHERRHRVMRWLAALLLALLLLLLIVAPARGALCASYAPEGQCARALLMRWG